MLDDGLQHYRLRRDLEIAVVDARGFGNGFLLPAGPLARAAVAAALRGCRRRSTAQLEGARGLSPCRWKAKTLHRMTDARDRQPRERIRRPDGARGRRHRRSQPLLPAPGQARHQGAAASVSRPSSLSRRTISSSATSAGPDDREGRGKIAPRCAAQLVGPAGHRAARSAFGDWLLRARLRWLEPSIQSCLRSWCARCARASSSIGRTRASSSARPTASAYPVKDDIPVMLEEEARKLPPEEEVACELSTSSSRRATRRRASRASRSPTSPASRWWCGSASAQRRAARRRCMSPPTTSASPPRCKRTAIRCVMTRADHPSGTDRIAEAAGAAQARATSTSWSTCRATSR